MPSAAPRLVESVESVSHALNAASFAVEPKKVITQSRMIVSEIHTAVRLAVIAAAGFITPFDKNTKLKIEIPHKMYPTQMNSLRLPILSDNAPISTVVSVAVTADAATIKEISAAVAWNIL